MYIFGMFCYNVHTHVTCRQGQFYYALVTKVLVLFEIATSRWKADIRLIFLLNNPKTISVIILLVTVSAQTLHITACWLGCRPVKRGCSSHAMLWFYFSYNSTKHNDILKEKPTNCFIYISSVVIISFN